VHGLVDEQGKEVRGVEAFKKFHRQFLSAFPDINVEVVDTISEGEKLVARCIVRGTHQGDGLGIKATGRKIEFAGACTVRIRNGKIVEAWNDFDFLTMHRQLDSLKLLS
jgi:predicted ester cyclase